MRNRNKKYVIGNWKALPNSWAEARELLDFTSEFFGGSVEISNSIVICPPFIYLEEVSKVLETSSLGSYIELGAQDVALSDAGAQTGEITGEQLAKLNVRYVIVGHSERRWPSLTSFAEGGKLGESDEIVNKKLKLALKHELTPIVCIGERERNDDFKNVLKDQVKKTFAGLDHDELEKCFLAYEPVWAISTNPNAKPDSPEESIKAIKAIWGQLNELGGEETWLPTLYGGSVTPNNISEFITQKEVDGVLVGGASVRKEDFVKILRLTI